MKRLYAIIISFAMLVTAAAIPAPAVLAAGGNANDRMYMEGTRRTAYKAGFGYNLTDMDGDGVSELFVTKPNGKYLKLSIYRYNKKTGGVTSLATHKDVTAMWRHYSGDVVVATHDSPKDTYIRYTFNGKKLSKKAVLKTKKIKRSGKSRIRYYKNSKVIKASTYKKNIKWIKKLDRFVTRSAGSPWIDSNIAGFAELAGDRGVADDAHLSLNYDFLSVNHLEEGMSSAGVGIDANGTLREHLGKVVRGTYGKGDAASNLARYFRIKTDWETRDKRGVKPVIPYLEEIDSISSLPELGRYLTDSRKLKLAGFFDFMAVIDPNDPAHYCGVIGPNGYLDDMVINVGESVLIRCGYSNKVRSRMIDNATEIESAIKGFEDSGESEEEPSEPTDVFNSVSYQSVVSKCKAFPLQEMLSDIGFTDGRIILQDPDYLDRLDRVYTSDNLQKLKDYIMLYTAAVASDRLDSQEYEYSRRVEGYFDEETGVEYNFPEDEETQRIQAEEGIIQGYEDPYLTPAIQNAYVQSYVSPSDRSILNEYIYGLKSSYRKMLQEEEWLSAETRAKAVEKLDAMKITALYPDVLPDVSYLDVRSTDTYLDAYARNRMGTIRNHGAAAGDVRVRGAWRWDIDTLFPTTEFNAFYYSGTNEAFICAGYLELMDDLSTVSREEMDGRLGFVIGHEITHGFDSAGASFDKDGKSAVTADHPYGWWTQEDYESFQKKVDKVAEYYDKIVLLPDITLYGYGLTGEAIADMGGFKLMLRMAEDRATYDYDKFFRAYASGIFCIQRYPSFEGAIAEMDEHPVGYLRTNVVVQQFDKFYETYGIGEGDGMYLAPEDRIAVW